MNALTRLLLGASPELSQTLNAASIIAATDITTLISGESGTGKELVARGIHSESARRSAPFVHVDCASLQESLVDALLFGKKKESGEEDDADTPGSFRAATAGTLYLEDVSELPNKTQAKLAHYLKTGECFEVDQTHPYKPMVRIIAASDYDLYDDVRQGRFREEFYYQLCAVTITMPALRERRLDIPALLEHFSLEFAEQFHSAPPSYAKDTLKVLQKYPWPGNVLELRNLAQRMALLHAGTLIEPDKLPPAFSIEPERDAPSSAFKLPVEGVVLDSVEADLIKQALHRSKGNRSKAARLLGLSRDTLLYRIKKYSLEPEG